MASTSATNIRQEMALKGWQSEDRMTTFGFGQDIDGSPNWGYSIWFERWDWHGKPCQKVSFVIEIDDISEVSKAVRKAADMALKAWNNYTTFPPDQEDLKEIHKNTTKLKKRVKK